MTFKELELLDKQAHKCGYSGWVVVQEDLMRKAVAALRKFMDRQARLAKGQCGCRAVHSGACGGALKKDSENS